MPAKNHVELVDKAMRVLEALAQEGDASDLKDLSARVGLVKSSAFRILYTLRELGYVEQRGRGLYCLTPKLFRLAKKAPAQASLNTIAHPYLLRLRDALDEAAWLAQWRRGRVILTDVAEARHKLRLSLDIGDDCPLHASALGKAIAAYLPPEELAKALGSGPFPRLTQNTNTDPAQLFRELAGVRESGYALNEEETIDGAILIGAPVFDARNAVLASVSTSCPIARCSPDKRKAMIAEVKAISAAISHELLEAEYRAE